MDHPHFFWGYLPFWLWTYGLAVVAWSCIGRFLLGFMLPPDSPNYIWRWFRRMTDWAIALVGLITPRYVDQRYAPLVAMYWCFLIRYASWPAFSALGLAPSLTPS
ncbi:MAG: YggT family protein [Proteobacteria bacterium]|nr:YggT family protein [Pseudomonadota bacterium]